MVKNCLWRIIIIHLFCQGLLSWLLKRISCVLSRSFKEHARSELVILHEFFSPEHDLEVGKLLRCFVETIVVKKFSHVFDTYVAKRLRFFSGDETVV